MQMRPKAQQDHWLRAPSQGPESRPVCPHGPCPQLPLCLPPLWLLPTAPPHHPCPLIISVSFQQAWPLPPSSGKALLFLFDPACLSSAASSTGSCVPSSLSLQDVPKVRDPKESLGRTWATGWACGSCFPDRYLGESLRAADQALLCNEVPETQAQGPARLVEAARRGQPEGHACLSPWMGLELLQRLAQ